jgi:hypothetical protein
MLGDKATSSVMMSAINGNENLQSDLNAYAMAKMKGDDSLFDKYVDGAYDSSADFWKFVKDEKGNWGWEPDGSLDFNFDLGNEEIREALFAQSVLSLINPKMSLDLSKMKINGDVGTIAFEDMAMEEMAKLGFNLGIKDPDGTKYLSKPGDSYSNVALSIFMSQTREKLEESVYRGNVINEYRSNTLQLEADGVGYGLGNRDKKGITLGSSASMDCTDLISYLTQRKKYGTSGFGVNPAFESSSVPMPGDVFIYTIPSNSSENHAVIWLGGNDIVESAWDIGPRTSTLDRLEGYYTNNKGLIFKREAYKLKRRFTN